MVPELDEPNTAAIDHVIPGRGAIWSWATFFRFIAKLFWAMGLFQFPHRHRVCRHEPLAMIQVVLKLDLV